MKGASAAPAAAEAAVLGARAGLGALGAAGASTAAARMEDKQAAARVPAHPARPGMAAMVPEGAAGGGGALAGTAPESMPGTGPGPGMVSGSRSGFEPVELVGELVGGGCDDPRAAGVGLAPADARPPTLDTKPSATAGGAAWHAAKGGRAHATWRPPVHRAAVRQAGTHENKNLGHAGRAPAPATLPQAFAGGAPGEPALVLGERTPAQVPRQHFETAEGPAAAGRAGTVDRDAAFGVYRQAGPPTAAVRPQWQAWQRR